MNCTVHRFAKVMLAFVLVNQCLVQAQEKEGRVAVQAAEAVLRVMVPALKIAPAVMPAPNRGLRAEPALKLTADDTDEALDAMETSLNRMGGAANLKKLKPRFESLVVRELRFMHEICKPMRRAQFAAIREHVGRAGRKATLVTARFEISNQQGRVIRNATQSGSDSLVEETLMMATDRHLSEEQARRYRSEIISRRTFRQEAEADMMLTHIDEMLRLTSEQRDSLSKVMFEAWTPDWNKRLKYIESNGLRFLPELPRSTFQRILNPEQRQIFKSMGRKTVPVVSLPMQMDELPPDVGEELSTLEDELVFSGEDRP